MLDKKTQNVEYLGNILIKQEQEFLAIAKKQISLYKKLGFSREKKEGEAKYELQSLLDESSSDDKAGEDEEDEEGSDGGETNDDTGLIIDLEAQEEELK